MKNNRQKYKNETTTENNVRVYLKFSAYVDIATDSVPVELSQPRFCIWFKRSKFYFLSHTYFFHFVCVNIATNVCFHMGNKAMRH